MKPTSASFKGSALYCKFITKNKPSYIYFMFNRTKWYLNIFWNHILIDFFVLGNMHRATSQTQCAFQVSSFVVLIRYETKNAKTVYSIRRDAITGGLCAVVFLVYHIKRSIQLRNIHMAPYSWCNEKHGPGGRGVYCLWLPLSKVWLWIAVRLVTSPTKNTNMLLCLSRYKDVFTVMRVRQQITSSHMWDLLQKYHVIIFAVWGTK